MCFLFAGIHTSHSLAASTMHRVYDNAGLLTENEINELENQAQLYSAKRNINFLIVTVNDTKGATTAEYSDKFYKQFISKHPKSKDCVILTVDMDNSYANVNGQGIAEEKLDNDRCSKIADQISSDLTAGNYFEACSTYITTAYKYLGFAEGMDPDSIFFKLWFQSLIAIIVGAIVVGIMVANSGGKVTVNQGTYLDQNDSQILARRDQYLHTTTTRVPKPKPVESSSSGGSGNSSGGSGSNGGSSF
jgi:Beta-propeller domains of methanol dehydrogenase type